MHTAENLKIFSEEDAQKDRRQLSEDGNLKANEFLYRRVGIEDVLDAHVLADEKAHSIRFGRYIISTTAPLIMDDLLILRIDAPKVPKRLLPYDEDVYARLGWEIFPKIERLYVNELARQEPGRRPTHDFSYIFDCLCAGNDVCSPPH